MLTIMHVRWRDSASCDAWTPDEEVREWAAEDMVVESVGFLVKKNDDYITLSSMKAGDMHACYHKIPRCSVIEIKELDQDIKTPAKDQEVTINGYSAGTLACHVMDRFADDPEKKDAIIKFMLQIQEGE